jgi:tetratricopeptide (TPR) repeat protein
MDYLSSKGTSQSSVKSETISSFQQAVRDFEDSIESQPRQLRAYYNLAVIEADHRHNEQEAITWLEKGLKFPNWEHEPVPALTCVAWFNLACYNARLFATQGEDAQARVKGCMEALEKAAAIGQLSPVDVEHEYSFKMEFLRQGSSHQLIPQDQQGDLSPLTQSGDEQTKLHLAELKTKLSTHFKENSPDTEEYY